MAAAGVRPGLGDGKGASVDDATDAAVAAAIGDGDKHGVTALEVAAWQGHTHVVDYLLRRGRASQMMLARSSNAC